VNDIPTIGTLMDQNHQLLQKITVSGELNDKLAEIARNNGATGAKMTGTGRGGLVIAVAPNEATQDQIAEIIEKEGYTVWKTTVG
jgi:mevalonate kinase